MSKYKSEAIPGFKVMEWLRKVREEDYKLRKENPEQYAMEMERIRKKIRARREQANKARKQPVPAA